MTDKQAAHAVVEQVRTSLPDIWLGLRQRHVLEQAIAAALATRERAVWTEAALYWDTMAEGPCKDGDDFAWACRVAAWCRQQAFKVKPIPAPEEG